MDEDPKNFTFRQAEARLRQIIENFDIPQERRGLTEKNLQWLNRNMGLGNDKNNIDYTEAVACLKKCLRHYINLRKERKS